MSRRGRARRGGEETTGATGVARGAAGGAQCGEGGEEGTTGATGWRGCGELEVGSNAGWHACAGRISVEVSGMESTVSILVLSAEAMRDREP